MPSKKTRVTGRAPSYSPSWAPEIYTPRALAQVSETALRREYQRIRKLANSRLQTLSRSRFSEDKPYQTNKDLYVSSRGLTREEVARLVVAGDRFLRAKTSTVRGAASAVQKQIETLNEHFAELDDEDDEPVPFITSESEAKLWGDFWEYIRTRNKELQYDSERIVEFWREQRVRRGMTPSKIKRAFDAFNEREKRTVEILNKTDGISAAQAREMAAEQLRREQRVNAAKARWSKR